jgi:hypothetical protein
LFEVRGLDTKPFEGEKIGNILHMEEGTIAGGKFHPKGGGAAEDLPKVEATRGPGGDNHFANFIAGVRSRRREDLNADIVEGHYSAACCHLANISYRLGEMTPFDTKAPILGDSKPLGESFERMREHLGDNQVKLAGLEYKLGRFLSFDAKSERFVLEPEADRMLTRDYPEGFAVPERIG